MMVLDIAYREFRNLFLTPLAWVILGVVQFILAWFFFSSIEVFFSLQDQLTTMSNPPGVTDLVISPLFRTAGIVLLMVLPLLTMRLISEERRNHTLSLLQSAPLSISEIVIGKYLGLLMFITVVVAVISLMPVSLYLGTTPDTGKLIAGLLGLFLLLAAFSAAGIYMSSLTDNPMVAAISSFGLLLLLWIINTGTSQGGANTDASPDVLGYQSMHTHFSNMLRGIVNTADIAYFILFILCFIILTIRQMETIRLQS